MKILLIYPFCQDDRLQEEDAAVVPMGLYYIGALLKANRYDVEILNFHPFRKEPQTIEKILKERQPDVIGFSIFNANRWSGIDIAEKAKAINPAVKIVFGGVGATFLWKHFLKNFEQIDYVVLGEGEHTFLNLIRAFEAEDDAAVEAIRGIAFRKDATILKNAAADRIDTLDQLPPPADFFDFQHIALSRGCPGKCTFCGSPDFWGPKVRFHSADYFVNQIERLYRRGITFFYVSDDTFTLKKKLVLEICRQIIARNLNITWAAISRVNCVDDEILRWMRKAGCVQISYGVESGSETIRTVLNKNIRDEEIRSAFNLTVKYGILARAYFIYGCPGETDRTIQETIDLIGEIKPLVVIFYILELFPGTRLYEDFKQRTGISDDIWLNRIEDIPYFENDPDLSEEKILAFGRKLKTTYFQRLPEFAESIELVDDPEFYALHADFLSRLAMTFSHGDYARNDRIKGSADVAEHLYRRALTYHPDYRAFWGLGMLLQLKKAFKESVDILDEGLRLFPSSRELCICRATSLMNLSEYRKALESLLKFQDHREAQYYIANCYQALGEPRQADAFIRKYSSG